MQEETDFSAYLRRSITTILIGENICAVSDSIIPESKRAFRHRASDVPANLGPGAEQAGGRSFLVDTKPVLVLDEANVGTAADKEEGEVDDGDRSRNVFCWRGECDKVGSVAVKG